jgi:hypothetical protein
MTPRYINEHTILGRLRDCVAGAFVICSKNVIPFQKKVAPIDGRGATGLRRELIMDNLSRSLPGNPKKLDISPSLFDRQKNSFQSTFQSGGDFFSQAFTLPKLGDNRVIEFSDMDPILTLISHKTAKNGIPAVRTIASAKIAWIILDFSQRFFRKCRCFLLNIADVHVYGALKPGFNAPISVSHDIRGYCWSPCLN